jgi:hypothetical protein
MVILISTGRPWLPLELASLHTRNRINEHPGILMESMDTTRAPHWTTTDVTKFISQKTKGTRIVDTVQFFPSKMSMPHTSSKDLAIIAALELSNALQNSAPVAPFSHIGTAQLQALRQLS